MSLDIFKVKKPGLLTTVQDLGRAGYQQYGMVMAGAMDSFSLQVGNLLVANKRGEAALEITLIGPELEILNDTVIAICGADLSPMIDGREIPLWKSFKVEKGQKLHFGAPKKGARTYLAVAGGIDVPSIMQSKSTYIKSSIGGFEGRSLEKGDIIKRGSINGNWKSVIGRGLSNNDIPDFKSSFTAKVIIGPDKNAFSKKGLNTFINGTYEVTQNSDRMGYRLSGPKIEHKEGADIISDAIAPGTIQVPANGEPIVLLADRQTTGGYARIGTIVSTDLPYIAQLLPGNKLSFEEVSVDEAQRLYVKEEKFLRELSVAAGVI